MGGKASRSPVLSERASSAPNSPRREAEACHPEAVSRAGQRIGSKMSTPLQRGALRAGGGVRQGGAIPRGEAGRGLRAAPIPYQVVFRSINCDTSDMYCNSRHAHRWIFMDNLHPEQHAPTALNVTVAATRKRQVRRCPPSRVSDRAGDREPHRCRGRQPLGSSGRHRRPAGLQAWATRQ